MGKHSVQIDDTELYNNIVEYCKLNNLKIGNFITELVRKQFMIEQYGDIPFGNFNEINPVLPEGYKTPEPISIPYISEVSSEVITSQPIDEKYQKKEVPKEYYSEITIEDVNKAVEIIEKHTTKPKKRRL